VEREKWKEKNKIVGRASQRIAHRGRVLYNPADNSVNRLSGTIIGGFGLIALVSLAIPA
jgi:Txe/YoeB family toxin of Txe-Axe toxin-antitoxin module